MTKAVIYSLDHIYRSLDQLDEYILLKVTYNTYDMSVNPSSATYSLRSCEYSFLTQCNKLLHAEVSLI